MIFLADDDAWHTKTNLTVEFENLHLVSVMRRRALQHHDQMFNRSFANPTKTYVAYIFDMNKASVKVDIIIMRIQRTVS